MLPVDPGVHDGHGHPGAVQTESAPCQVCPHTGKIPFELVFTQWGRALFHIGRLYPAAPTILTDYPYLGTAGHGQYSVCIGRHRQPIEYPKRAYLLYLSPGLLLLQKSQQLGLRALGCCLQPAHHQMLAAGTGKVSGEEPEIRLWAQFDHKAELVPRSAGQHPLQ